MGSLEDSIIKDELMSLEPSLVMVCCVLLPSGASYFSPQAYSSKYMVLLNI